MSPQVFYRKWRPQRLDDVIGQEPVTRTLKQAILTNRVAHAYLLAGPRGTGKTSTARILSKAINCLGSDNGEPCNSCNICQSVNDGRSVDLIEIDAASHRGIDDIRNIREKVHFLPNEVQKKVYIIDEAHMLTTEAFNALLKTLEEPPSHVIFILATTEAHKLPVTITSRCQRFDFRRINHEDIANRLKKICEEEVLEVTFETLLAIARLSSGSLRDAENLLEQLALSYSSPISIEQFNGLFGLGNDEKAIDLVENILNGDITKGLITINDIISEGHDLAQLHKSILDLLRDIMLLKSGVDTSIAYPKDILVRLRDISNSFEIDHVIIVIKIFAELGLKIDSSSPIGLELALIESANNVGQLTTREGNFSIEPLPVISDDNDNKILESFDNKTNIDNKPRVISQVNTPIVPTKLVNEPASENNIQINEDKHLEINEPQDKSQFTTQWELLVKTLSRQKGKRFFIGALLRSCKSHSIDSDKLVLKYSHKSHMERMKEEWEDPSTRKAIKEAMEQIMGHSYELVIAADDMENGNIHRPLADSHLVRAAIKMGAAIIDEKEGHDE